MTNIIQTAGAVAVGSSAVLGHTVSLPIVICLCSAFWILGLIVGTVICSLHVKRRLSDV